MKKQLEFVGAGSEGAVLGYPRPTSMKDLWTAFVPAYRSQNYGPAMFAIHWDREKAIEIGKINPRRLVNRFAAYVIEGELARSRAKLEKSGNASIRFGNLKEGIGYHKERGDFCLIAAACTKRHLTVYYRSLEMIGGFGYDLALLAVIESTLGCNWQDIRFVTAKAFVFALKGNSNEKLYPKLKGIFNAD